MNDEIEKVCREILSPLVRADGGQMYLVESTAEEVHIHLAGACAGCPGAQFTTERIIEPALRNAHPKGRVRVTTGYLIPTGATLIP